MLPQGISIINCKNGILSNKYFNIHVRLMKKSETSFFIVIEMISLDTN